MVQNTNNLLENLDFKGSFSLLKSQIEKPEKVHVTIQNIREENFDLRKEFEKSRATIVNIRKENFRLRKELESIKAIYSESNNQALEDRPVLQSSNTWQKPDKTFKPTTSLPACNPFTTSNLFERLPVCPTDGVDVTSAPSFDVQMENVHLQ